MLNLAALRRTTGLFPTQYEGLTDDSRPVYIRCKHGELSVRVGRPGETIDEAIGAGPILRLEFVDDHRSELDWIEIEALTGIRLPPSEDGVTIVDAAAADAEEIAVLMRRVRCEALPYLPRLHDAAADRRFVAGLIADATVRVARSDRILGFSSRRPGWVDQLYIDAGWRSHGIGSRLLGEALVGAASVRLWTLQRNEAARVFYVRRGFVEVEQTDGSGNEEGEPDVLMLWQPGLLP